MSGPSTSSETASQRHLLQSRALNCGTRLSLIYMHTLLGGKCHGLYNVTYLIQERCLVHLRVDFAFDFVKTVETLVATLRTAPLVRTCTASDNTKEGTKGSVPVMRRGGLLTSSLCVSSFSSEKMCKLATIADALYLNRQ